MRYYQLSLIDSFACILRFDVYDAYIICVYNVRALVLYNPYHTDRHTYVQCPSSSRKMPRRTVRTFGLCQGGNSTSTPAIAVRKARDRIIHRMPMPKHLASIAIWILNSASARIAIPMAIKVNVIVSKGFSKAMISKTVGLIPSRQNSKLENALII